VAERLHHGVWANAVDAAIAQFSHAGAGRAACELGASPSDVAGDVTLRDGTSRFATGPARRGLVGAARLGRAPSDLARAQVAGTARLERASWSATCGRPTSSCVRTRRRRPGHRAGRVWKDAGADREGALVVQGWGLPPDAVALVAYNTRAADEMRERLGDVAGVRIRTLNALALRLATVARP